MSCEWKGIQDWEEHRRKCRIAQAEHLSDNLYERIRTHIVRVMRESENNVHYTAEKLGCSESTVRRYMKMVPFEHLMRNPALADRFDWRSMTCRKWEKLLRKHPDFIHRLPRKNGLTVANELNILLSQPGLSEYFDLQEWNSLGLSDFWSRLLQKHPEFAPECDFTLITAVSAMNLLVKQPQFFDRIKIETLLPYHWEFLLERQPAILAKMEAKPHEEWPFNFKVFYLRIHPEFENEFQDWEKIDWTDWEDIQRDQPELYVRHHEKSFKECK